MDLEKIAHNLNILAEFCGRRDVDRLTQDCLYEKYGIRRADCMILFGGSIPCGGDVAAQAYQDDLAEYFIISGGEGHTTECLRKKFHCAFWDMEVAGKKEADIYAEYLYRQYGIVPDWIERDSTNCGNNVTNTLGILRQNQIFPKTILLVQDASMQNRMDAGFRKYLGDSVQIINYASYRVQVEVRDGALAFSPNDIWGMWSMEEYITLLMGEIPRLLDDEDGYGPNGKNFIAHVEIPSQVMQAFEELKTVYGHLIRPAQEQYASR